MATTSATAYMVAGLQIGLNVMQDAASSLPPPLPTVVNISQRVIATSNMVSSNKETCTRLRTQVLEILPVVIANTEKVLARSNEDELPDAFRYSLDLFQSKLESTLDVLDKMAKITSSKRKRDIPKKWLLSTNFSGDLQQCEKDLDWAMKEFDVAASLASCAHLYEVSKQVGDVHAHSFLESLPRARFARHDSERPDHPSSCFPGTRRIILEEIDEWSRSHEPSSLPFYWLKGPAGTGKTTVALSVAEKAQASGLLGGSFFFSRRGEADLRDPARVFPTLAYQLARFDRAIGHAIVSALGEDPEAPYRSRQRQLENLLIVPLSKVHRAPKRVVLVVLDAFDECEPRGAETILRLLVASLPRLPFFLKIFVTSRDEEHIHQVLEPANGVRRSALQDIEQAVVKDDIRSYLDHELRQPGMDGREPLLPIGCLSDGDLAILTDAAGTLFIHAATSVRFLRSAKNPAGQLKFLLRSICSPSSGARTVPGQFHNLDQLYEDLLLRTFTPENEHEVLALLQSVLGGLVLLRDPLPVDALERLLDLTPGGASACFSDLRSVIIPSAPHDNCPRIYHRSFPDYVQDPRRCTDTRLWIDTATHESRMACRCLEIMNNALHLNMLEEPFTRLLNDQVADLPTKVAKAFSADLRYVCLFWISHLVKVPEQRITGPLLTALEKFARMQLLAWLECLSWLGRIDEGIRSLSSLCAWITKVNCHSTMVALFRDANRLLLAHKDSIQAAALHIPHSVLPFIPEGAILAGAYPKSMTVTVFHGNPKQWGAELATLRGHSGPIHSIAFSPDGSCIVSASFDGTIKSWDIATGEILRTLEGYSGAYTSIAFSPDGSRIVSGCSDSTVEVWDITTGEILQKFEVHSGIVASVAFSPKGSSIVSGSHDETVKVWDVMTGETLQTFKGHWGFVTSVAFSPNGLLVVSGSSDTTVKIWDTITGETLQTFEGHMKTIICVAFSPDGSRIVSCSYGRTVLVWNVTTGERLQTLEGHSGTDGSVAFSPDGSRIVSGSIDNTAKVWDATTGENLQLHRDHSQNVLSVAFSPDGSRVVSGSSDKTVRIWDVTTGQLLQTLGGRSEIVTSVAFSPDMSRIVSGGLSDHYDATVVVWDVTTGEILRTLEGHSRFSRVIDVTFSPDGSRVTSRSDDGRTIDFDTYTGARFEIARERPLPIPPRPNVSLSTMMTDINLMLAESGPTGQSVKHIQGDLYFLVLPASFGLSSAARIYRMPTGNVWRVAVGYHNGHVLILELHVA